MKKTIIILFLAVVVECSAVSGCGSRKPVNDQAWEHLDKGTEIMLEAGEIARSDSDREKYQGLFERLFTEDITSDEVRELIGDLEDEEEKKAGLVEPVRKECEEVFKLKGVDQRLLRLAEISIDICEISIEISDKWLVFLVDYADSINAGERWSKEEITRESEEIMDLTSREPWGLLDERQALLDDLFEDPPETSTG